MTFGIAPSRSSPETQGVNERRLITIGTAGLIATAILFPRSATAMFLVAIAATLAFAFSRADWRMKTFQINPVLLAMSGFAVWSLLSAAWSAAPMASLSKPLYLLAGASGMTMIAAIAWESSVEDLQASAYGMLIGFSIGAAAVCVETVTDQSIAKFFFTTFSTLREGYDKHVTVENGIVVHVSDGNINRRATAVTLLLLPVALLACTMCRGTARKLGIGLVIAVAAIMMAASSHQSSQAAILAGAAAFGLAKVSAVWTRRAAGVAWCASCLLMVPLVLFLHSLELHKNNAVFHSARHRVVIWNTTAEAVKKAPLAGIGADATAALTEARTKAKRSDGKSELDGAYEVTQARHAHNVFLQVWYELGAAGAVLFTAAGLAVLALSARVQPQYQPFLLGQFAAFAAMIAFSFSIWQLWLEGVAGLSVLAIVTALAGGERGHETAPGATTSFK